MHLDDRLVGRLLSRRAALHLLGAGGFGVLSSATVLSAQDAPAMAAQCVVRPEMTEGPYFLDKRGMRADIRAEASTGARKPGVPLGLGFAVSQVAAGMCSPLSNAVVDVWQCDAVGAYSGVVDPRFPPDTVKQGFLRGALQTDASGAARFMTIYPGWYSGRAVHIHFKIRTVAAGAQADEFTSQLFLPET